MRQFLKRYRAFLLMIVVFIVITVIHVDLGRKAFDMALLQIKEMIQIIPPIFLLLGLLDVWVPKETMVRFMGEKSGLKGITLALLIGSATAGPLYGAFPVAAVFMKKGVKFSNVLIFLGAWSTTKIPMFLFEMSALGIPFALTRLLIDIPGIILIAFFLSAVISKEDQEAIYKQAEAL